MQRKHNKHKKNHEEHDRSDDVGAGAGDVGGDDRLGGSAALKVRGIPTGTL